MFGRVISLCFGLVMLFILGAAGIFQDATAAPVVTNVSMSQRVDGSGLVDIYYDVAGGVEPMKVSLTFSGDNGATWNIYPSALNLSGDAGNSVTNGTGKHIVYDVMADRTGICWTQGKVRVSATDYAPGLEEITILLPGDVPLVLVKIPAGSFLMGHYPLEENSEPTEQPQHTVTIAYDFFMGKYEITQKQWLAVMGSWPGPAPDATCGIGDNRPAYKISWNDAQNFVTTLNGHITTTGQGPLTVRLPSEAEWEYACRAGTTTRFYWGDDPTYSQMPDYIVTGDLYPGETPVGTKLPNNFGLYDMSGSVHEWSQDYFHDNYTDAPIDGSAWEFPTEPYRSYRSYYNFGYARYPRSAARHRDEPTARSYMIGMRLVATQ